MEQTIKTDPDAQRSRLRVGVVTTSFPVKEGSTSGVFVQRLVRYMPEDIAATVLAPCPDAELPSPHGHRYGLICFSYGPRPWRRLAHRPGGIPEAARRRDPALLLLPLFIASMFLACWRLAGKVDVIHGNWSVPGVIAAIAARLRGRSAIATLRGTDVKKVEDSSVFRWLLGACLRLNRYTVAVSPAIRDELRDRFPGWADRVAFIPNGVELPTVAAPLRFGAPLKLLTIGNLVPGKRVETLLHAVALLQSETDVVLRIVGDGPERDRLCMTAEDLGLRDHVELVGTIPPEEIGGQLQWADIFVFASAAEGRPNAVLEAMAAGLPTIATDIPGIRELIAPDIGLLFPVGDATALAQGIRGLQADPATARAMGRAARGRIEAGDFTWAVCAERYTRLYADAAGCLGVASCVV